MRGPPPIVPILKPDKKVRICGDFKVIINPVLDVDRYPLPILEELLATVSGLVIGPDKCIFTISFR